MNLSCDIIGHFTNNLRQGNGLYMTDWASMDNSPRNVYLTKGGCAVDTSSQMVMFADDLAMFAGFLGKQDEAVQFKREAATTRCANKQTNVGS